MGGWTLVVHMMAWGTWAQRCRRAECREGAPQGRATCTLRPRGLQVFPNAHAESLLAALPLHSSPDRRLLAQGPGRPPAHISATIPLTHASPPPIATPPPRGQGGSMHMFSQKHGLLGGYAFIGEGIPVGLGAAFQSKYK